MIEFDWLIHYKCNYRCPYCFFNGFWHEVEKRNKYLENKKWVEAFKRVSKTCDKIKIIITGGEPLLYPGFIDLISELNKFSHISFDTNLSPNSDDIKVLANRINPKNIFLGLSYHPTFADLDEFVEKAMILKENGFDVRIHYVTYPEQLSNMMDVKNIFTLKGFRFTPLPFRGIYKDKKYPESFDKKEIEYIKSVIGGIADSRDVEWVNKQISQVKSKNRLCHAGQFYARIDNDGTVYPCSNDYVKSDKKMILGNLFDTNFSLNNKPMLCRQESCPCEFRWIEDKSATANFKFDLSNSYE